MLPKGFSDFRAVGGGSLVPSRAAERKTSFLSAGVRLRLREREQGLSQRKKPRTSLSTRHCRDPLGRHLHDNAVRVLGLGLGDLDGGSDGRHVEDLFWFFS